MYDVKDPSCVFAFGFRTQVGWRGPLPFHLLHYIAAMAPHTTAPTSPTLHKCTLGLRCMPA